MYKLILAIITALTLSNFDSLAQVNQPKLLFTYVENNYGQIGLVNLEDKSFRKFKVGIKSPRGEYNASFSPDGTKMAFNTYHYGGWKIALSNSDGSKAKKAITNSNAYSYAPEFSPDGKWIVYYGHISGNTGTLEIFKALVSDGKRFRLTNGKHWNVMPGWSPDGKLITYTYYDYDQENYQIHVMKQDGSDIISITNSKAQHFSSGFSPDGKKIAFVSTEGSFYNLYIYDLDSKNTTLITNFTGKSAFKYSHDKDFNDLEFAYGLDWSKTGQIAFTVKENGRHSIYIVNSDKTNLKRAMDTEKEQSKPKWSF